MPTIKQRLTGVDGAPAFRTYEFEAGTTLSAMLSKYGLSQDTSFKINNQMVYPNDVLTEAHSNGDFEITATRNKSGCKLLLAA